MKIKADFLRISTATHDAGGARIEPEEQMAQRVQTVEVPATLRTANGEVDAGSMKGAIVQERPAIQIAHDLQGQCFRCRWFNVKRFRTWLRDNTKSVEGMKRINEIRWWMSTTNNHALAERHVGEDGEIDAEHGLTQLGICGPLSEMAKDEVIIHMTGSCPGFVRSEMAPLGMFQAKDTDSEKFGAAAYDGVMQRAAGKMP